MPIKLVLEINHPKGEPDITRPICLCEACGGEITKQRPGLYLWDGRRENAAYWDCEPVTFHLAHAGHCWQKTVEALGLEEWEVSDMMLEYLVVYLANVLDIGDEKKRTRWTETVL